MGSQDAEVGDALGSVAPTEFRRVRAGPAGWLGVHEFYCDECKKLGLRRGPF